MFAIFNKKLFLWVCVGGFVLYIAVYSSQSTYCFLAVESDSILMKKGECGERNSPYCTFNYVLSLAGYDLGILKDEYQPVWSYQEGYVAYFNSWKRDQYPLYWSKTSCVWYAQLLAEKIGIEGLQGYIDMMAYGNQDIGGDEGKNNGLNQSWMESSLEISPMEQVHFIQQMLNKDYPVSEHAYEMTKRIFYIGTLPSGWQLYGKTGSGFQLSANRKNKKLSQSGWFLGWVEKGDRQIVFTVLLKDRHPLHSILVFNRAKELALQHIEEIIH